MITDYEFNNRTNNLHNATKSKTKTATCTDSKPVGNILHFRRVKHVARVDVRNKISPGAAHH